MLHRCCRLGRGLLWSGAVDPVHRQLPGLDGIQTTDELATQLYPRRCDGDRTHRQHLVQRAAQRDRCRDDCFEHWRVDERELLHLKVEVETPQRQPSTLGPAGEIKRAIP